MFCIILYKHDKVGMIMNDLKKLDFLFSFILLCVISIYSWHSKNKKLKKSSQHAIIAFLIAYLGRLDLVFAAYFIIFIFAYYTDDGEWL